MRFRNYDLVMLFIASLLVTAFIIAGFIIPAAKAEGDASAENILKYVGAEKCKMCHLRQYKSWAETGMAKAWERIKDADDKEKCYPCHTTGYNRPNGFKSIEATPNLGGVQCESCHGPGSEHTSLPVSEKDPEKRKSTINKDIQDCRVCHNPHIKNKAEAVRNAGK